MKRFLLCTDGSSYSAVSCQYAAWLASHADASITVLYVTDVRQFDIPFVADFSGSLGIQPYQDLIGRMKVLERDKAATIEQATRNTLDYAGFTGPVTFVHRTGLLVDVVEEMEKEADLVILGKRGASADVAIHHLGSNLERVVRATRKPSLVTSRAYKDINRMLLALDGEPSSRKGLDFLCTFKALNDLDLHVVTVLNENQKEETAQTILDEAENRLAASGYSPKTVVLYGTAEEAIADYVKTEEIDLLLMGAYGKSRIRSLLIGGTSTTLIRTCRIPILCFR